MMRFITLFCLLLLFSLSFIFTEIHGMSKEEEVDVEFEELLKFRNKLEPIKTIKTKVGDIYDCIHIQTQPTLNHPLLKNHTIQMEPAASSVKDETNSLNKDKYSWARLITVNCPKGSVPIRRLAEKDLRRSISFSRSYASSICSQTKEPPSIIRSQTKEQPILHYDLLQTRETSERFFGVSSYISVQNINLGGEQSNTAQMWIENNEDQERPDNLQTGWTINQELNGDGQTRLFVYGTTAAGGCFNTLCHGFILVNSGIAIDVPILPVSEYGGKQYVLKLHLMQENDHNCVELMELNTNYTDGMAWHGIAPAYWSDGHWWLQLVEGRDLSEDKTINIGYWPKEILPSLIHGAHYAAWGGLAVGPHGDSPPLGNGHPFHPNTTDTSRQSFFARLKIFGFNFSIQDPPKDILEINIDSPKCYGLKFLPDNRELEQTIVFGGEGGDCDLQPQ